MVEHEGAEGESGGQESPSSVKWGLQSHLPVGLGLKEIIHESVWHRVGPIDVLINVPLAA